MLQHDIMIAMSNSTDDGHDSFEYLRQSLTLMHASIEIWDILAGIAIFMLGMNFLENSLKQLSGRKFKLMLRKQTEHKVTAIGGAAVITALLQSSSVVNLMVLAFASAGVITMQNALAVMLGSNLGTTMNTWLVATLGFSFNIELYALPLVAAGGAWMLLSNKTSKWHTVHYLLFGLGFLFIGLNFLRSGVENMVNGLDKDSLKDHALVYYVLFGTVVTAIIQSSSATMAITLSALFANAISLYDASAVALGAEIGTTIKLLLAATSGPVIKKRIAWGNIIYNTATSAILLILLQPVLYLITEVIGIKDNLIALSFFQTFTNIAGIILFFPFLKALGNFLERRFTEHDDTAVYVSCVPVTDTHAAIEALHKESARFIHGVLIYMMEAFDITITPDNRHDLDARYLDKTPAEKYEYIKHLHGDIYSYYTRIRQYLPEDQIFVLTDKQIASVRNAMYAAKNIKDIAADIDQLRNSSHESKYNFFLRSKERMETFCADADSILDARIPALATALYQLFERTQSEYNSSLRMLYTDGTFGELSESEISTVINFNRELYTAFKSIVIALKDAVLEEKEAVAFNDLPGFIR